MKLCQAEKKERDIRWPLTNGKRDWERTDTRRSSHRLWVRDYKPKGYAFRFILINTLIDQVVNTELVIDVKAEEVVIALLKDKRLVELTTEKTSVKFAVGDIYD